VGRREHPGLCRGTLVRLVVVRLVTVVDDGLARRGPWDELPAVLRDLKDGEISARAAAAPRHTTISGFRTANSASSHGWQARRCSGRGVWWIRRFGVGVK
jgi:hypothetical protein